jgi:3-phosphoshikimate 1-carboxyvinyltransferase
MNDIPIQNSPFEIRHSNMSSVTVHPSSSLQGTLNLPGDKSISHRAIIFSSLAEGETRIQNLLEGEDVLCTIECFRAMGVSIEKVSGLKSQVPGPVSVVGGDWIVRGVGLHGLKKPKKVLYCGNSGTTMRLLMGILAAQPFESALTGDSSLNRRPMKRVMDPLSQMGAQFSVEGEGSEKRIVRVKGGPLKGISYASPIASAQVKSAILLAGLWAKGATSLTEPTLSRDHTERILSASGVSFQRRGTQVTISAAQTFKVPSVWKVPGDFSSAAFFLVAGGIAPNSQVKLEEVGLNKTRTGALDVLKAMGASIEVKDLREEGGEEVGTLVARFSPLKSFSIGGGELIPRLIDEIPILAIAASCALGTTEVRDATELKVKESDRIQTLCHLLNKIGVPAKERQDGLTIEGGHVIKKAEVESFGDHRMAMSMAVAALVANGPIYIKDVACVNTSFPTFWESLKKLGVQLEK